MRSDATPGHVRDAAVIMLVSVDTPAYETSAQLLDIDKREVDRVQKAFMAGGVTAVLNLPLGLRAVYHGKLKQRKHGHVARMKTILAQSGATAPESIEQLSKQLTICKDYSRKLAKKHGIEMPSPYSDKVLGEKIRALLRTKPKKHAKWTYLEAAGIVTRDLRDDAQTINTPGLTLVPLGVRLAAGDVVIRAKDPRYATPGPDEAQKFAQ